MNDTNTPTDFDQLYPGRFIKAGDVIEETTVTIGAVHMDSLRSDEGGMKFKAILAFSHAPTKAKEMVLNKTNGFCVLGMFGRDPRAWVGKRITVKSEIVQFGPEKKPGVRVVGSPDIDKPMQVEIKLPQKKPKMVTMRPTGERPKPAAQQKPRPGTSDLTDLQKAAVVEKRKALAALIINVAEKETEESAVQRAVERMGKVGAASYDDWMVRAARIIAECTPPPADAAPEPENEPGF